MSHLNDNERVEADDGYIGEAADHVKCPKSFVNPEETKLMQQRCRNQQETVNKRFKHFRILKETYRHKIEDHGKVFRVVPVIFQMGFNNGKVLLQCGYRDPPYNTYLMILNPNPNCD